MSDKGLETRERILATAEPLILRQGFAGTSLDDILKGSGLTKGAFFHHFTGKADLARALVERYALNDFAVFDRLAEEADAATEDPLERAFLFLKLFEDFIERLPEAPAGCLLAAYVYEGVQFDASIHRFINDIFRRWAALYETKFEAVLKT
jgi:TetR/AcrR family transcriptional repressor of nem operon